MVTLEMFGSPATLEDGLVTMPYLVTTRCSTGCHFMSAQIDRRVLDDDPGTWDRLERHFRGAFARKHPEAA